jgi:prevent-host-death family protein
MTIISAKDARGQFSALLSTVAQGRSVTITRRGKAVALISPVGKPAPDRLPDLTAFRARIKTHGRDVTIADLRREERY